MATLTIRIPDEKHNRLKQLAAARQISMNKLMEELSTVALTEFDAHNRFRLLAQQGEKVRGLELLDKLDQLSD